MNPEAGDFVLPVDKPEGPTSHDVVASARRALETRRVGHTGTLDPFASGLLLLCVGRATRLAEYLSGLDKSYVAEARLGVETDTLDRDGRVVAESEAWRDVGVADVEAALASLVGEIGQVPPQFSAKKVEGEAMHRRARRGETVELAPVTVTVHSIEAEAIDLPGVRFRVRCSTGTYVRSLARDLGARLGMGAHLTALRRIEVGGFHVDEAVAVDDLSDEAAVRRARISPLDAIRHMARFEVDAEAAGRIRHGQRIRVDAEAVSGGRNEGPSDGPALVAVSHVDDLLAIASVEKGVLKPRKVFAT